MDDLHIASGNLDYSKKALRRFVAEFLLPDDRVAVVTSSGPGGVQQLTPDRAALQAAIDRLAARQANVAPARGSQMTAAQAELILRGDPNALQLATRLMMDEPGSVLSGQTAHGGGGGARAANPASVVDEKDRAAAQEVRRQARSILAEELRFSQITLSQVDDVLRSLASLPGRKICLLVSDGFLVGMGTSDEQTRHLRAVVDAATRSGAVVYALDARGLTTTGGDSSSAGAPAPPGLRERVDRLAAQESPRDALGARERHRRVSRAGNERASLPACGGCSRTTTPTTSWRTSRPTRSATAGSAGSRCGCRAVPASSCARASGYFAPDERKRAAGRSGPPLPDRPPAGSPRLCSTRPRSARSWARPSPRTASRCAWCVDYLDLPPAGSQAIVRAHVNLAGLPWQQAGGRRRADLELVGGVYDADGGPVGPPFAKRVELDLTPAEYERALKMGFQYQNRVARAPGRFEVRMIARDLARVPLGGAVQWVEIPDLKEGKLALSSVFLSKSAATAGAAAPGSGDAEALRDVQTLRRFKQSESLYFQLYVYNVARGRSRRRATSCCRPRSCRGASRSPRRSPSRSPSSARTGCRCPQSSGMSLVGLASGRYELRIVVVDRGRTRPSTETWTSTWSEAADVSRAGSRKTGPNPGAEIRGGHTGHLRRANLERIQAFVMDHPRPFTRAELIEATGLSAPTVGSLVAQLIRRGLVRDLGAGPSRGGRRPSFMEFNARYGFVAAIALGAGQDAARGRRPARRAARAPRDPDPAGPCTARPCWRGSPPPAPARSATRGCPREKLLVVARRQPRASSTGRAGRSWRSPRACRDWLNVPVARILARQARRPGPRRERRQPGRAGRALAGRRPRPRHLRLHQRGHGDRRRHPDRRRAAPRPPPHGRGDRLHVHGAPLRRAGLRGPRVPRDAGRPRGAGRALAARAPRQSPTGGWPSSYDAARAGDPEARAAVEEVATLVGIAAANLSLVIDPSLVVVGGTVPTPDSPFMDRVQRTVAGILPAPTAVIVSALGEEAPLWGGLLMATTHARHELRPRLPEGAAR